MIIETRPKVRRSTTWRLWLEMISAIPLYLFDHACRLPFLSIRAWKGNLRSWCHRGLKRPKTTRSPYWGSSTQSIIQKREHFGRQRQGYTTNYICFDFRKMYLSTCPDWEQLLVGTLRGRAFLFLSPSISPQSSICLSFSKIRNFRKLFWFEKPFPF